MSFSNESIGGGADGCIFGFTAELPMSMTSSEVEIALLGLDASVQAINEPPIAKVDPICGAEGPEEDRRRFTVGFESEATEEHMVAAMTIVTQAIRNYRHRA